MYKSRENSIIITYVPITQCQQLSAFCQTSPPPHLYFLFLWSILMYIILLYYFTNKYFRLDVQLIKIFSIATHDPAINNNSIILSNKQIDFLRWEKLRQDKAKRKRLSSKRLGENEVPRSWCRVQTWKHRRSTIF